jgi:hypothetical protein
MDIWGLKKTQEDEDLLLVPPKNTVVEGCTETGQGKGRRKESRCDSVQQSGGGGLCD